SVISRCKHQSADADSRCAYGNDPSRAKTIHRCAGNQAERRITVVEQPDHRSDTNRVERKGIAELRNHHGWSRAKRVLIKIVDCRQKPGSDSDPAIFAHANTRYSSHDSSPL